MSADRGHACDTCRALGAESRWGQAVGEDLPPDPPRELQGLEQVSENRRRCVKCGNLYEHTTSSGSFLNADYDSASVRRLGPHEYSDADCQAAYDRLAADLADPDAAVKSARRRFWLMTRWAGRTICAASSSILPTTSFARRRFASWQSTCRN